MAARISPPRQTWRFRRHDGHQTVATGYLDRLEHDSSGIGGRLVRVDIVADEVRVELAATDHADPEAANVYADILEEEREDRAAAILRRRVPFPLVNRLSPLRVMSYELVNDHWGIGVTLDRCGQIEGPDLWAIRRPGACLNRKGEWEIEPKPSSRTKAFFKRCRFASPEAALDVWDKAKAALGH